MKIDYFDYFTEIASLACEQAVYLHETLANYDPENLKENLGHMHSIEHTADTKKAEMIEQLIKEFLPPFDRDDIVSLAELYDTICDTIDDVLQKIYMYSIDHCREEAVAVSGKITEICREFYELTSELKEFRKPDNMFEKIETVNDMESEGDMLYSEAMHDLFKDENIDTKTILIWSNIYTALEDCFDACENAADLIKNVVIKNS